VYAWGCGSRGTYALSGDLSPQPGALDAVPVRLEVLVVVGVVLGLGHLCGVHMGREKREEGRGWRIRGCQRPVCGRPRRPSNCPHIIPVQHPAPDTPSTMHIPVPIAASSAAPAPLSPRPSSATVGLEAR
jgi:hypothetical protein